MAKKSFSMRSMAVAALLAAMPVLPAVAADQPLVTVRFNQPRVYFDQQLYSAIAKAVEVKPEVEFDVVANAPLTGNSTTDKQWQALSGRNTRAVVATMNQIGVPMERIRVTGESRSGLKYDETQVFAR